MSQAQTSAPAPKSLLAKVTNIFMHGVEVYASGLVVIILPQVLTYSSTFDFTQFGLSPNTASLIGAVLIAARGAEAYRRTK